MDVKQSRPSDAEMIQLIRSRGKTGAEALYDGYASILLLVIIRINSQEEIVECILEEALLKIWNTIELYSAEDGSLLSWMIAIARNTAKEHTMSPVSSALTP